MIFLDEKPRFTFANFLHLFIQGPPLTHSALVPVERFIDGKGGRKSLLKDYQVLAHFLSVRLGTGSACLLAVCVRAFYK